jgi:hypothetical protein
MLVAAQTGVQQTDVDQIIAAALDYAESAYEGVQGRMERALHPKLAKRAVFADQQTGKDVLHELTAPELIEWVAKGHGKQPESRRQRDVKVLDIYENTAQVRVDMNDWVDFMQIAKINGRWVIINVLWALKPAHKSGE